MKFKGSSLKKINNIRLLGYIFLITFISISSVHAAIYNYYFSNSGSGSTCSERSPCASLSAAQNKIDAATSDDTVNLYFNRGNSWSKDTTVKRLVHGLSVDANDPIVNIDAYGSGDRPVFDGLVSNFSTVADHNQSAGPLFWSRFFQFSRANCSVKNIEIKRVYGNGIWLHSTGDFTLEGCLIHHFGTNGIIAGGNGGGNITVEKNTFHTGQELWHYKKRNGWEGAIQLMERNCEDNIIRYNLVYDIYGEGIQTPNSLCEYNVVGNTASIGINTSPHDWDAKTTIVRYNFIIQEKPSEHDYDTLHGGGSRPVGIRVYDEDLGGDNSNADIQIYGNIIINRHIGIWLYNSEDSDNPFGSVKVYNNTIIDSTNTNIYIAHGDSFSNVKIYNNLSILYDNIGAKHVADQADFLPHPNWAIENNHFWTTGGFPAVDSDWRTNYVTSDPKLSGEPSIDWAGQTGITYYNNIDFNAHLSPLASSGNIYSGKILGSGYENRFLTTGTDFESLPYTTTIQKASQPVSSNWVTGAIIPGGEAPIRPPANLTISPY